MKKISIILAAVLALSACCGTVTDTQHLKRAENYGALDEGVESYLHDLRLCGSTHELNSVMVLKDGEILEEYYDNCYGPDFRNICWSASKTFTATAVGFAVQDGLFSIEDKVVDLIPSGMLPDNISDTLSSLNVYNLLRMSSGLKRDVISVMGAGELETPTKTTLSYGFAFAPGEKYRYNSFNTYLLSVIVTNATGKLVEDYLQEKLFRHMGIRNYHWDISTEGYNMGGWGLYITTEALAKMGQFFLQKGEWNGEQLLNREWMEQAMTAQIYQKGEAYPDDDHANGYGYQMWICTHNAARFDGAHGQWVFICPDKNAVIVITQHTNAVKMIDKVWTRIYDAI